MIESFPVNDPSRGGHQARLLTADFSG